MAIAQLKMEEYRYTNVEKYEKILNQNDIDNDNSPI